MFLNQNDYFKILLLEITDKIVIQIFKLNIF